MIVPYLGFYNFSFRKLAPFDLVVTHVGLPVLRKGSNGTPLDQRAVSFSKHLVVIFHSFQDDRSTFQECFCGGSFCLTSVTCGIGCMGFGKKRCIKHLFWIADDFCVLPLCQNIKLQKLFLCNHMFYIRTHGQTHAGDIPICVAVVGFLAA